MKKILLGIALLCSTSVMYSQSKEQKEAIAAIQDQYEVSNGEVVFTKTIEGINATKDEIYSRALAYFATAYKSANDVIQMQDKEAGTIIGKGIFTVSKSTAFIVSKYLCDHTLRIDAKDGRARVIIALSKYKNYDTPPNILEMNVVNTYPIAEKPQGSKKYYADIFLKAYNEIQESFSKIESDLKQDSASSVSSDW